MKKAASDRGRGVPVDGNREGCSMILRFYLDLLLGCIVFALVHYIFDFLDLWVVDNIKALFHIGE